MDRKERIKQGALIELAKREFFFYCQLKAPDFYKSDRTFLVNLCNGLQEFVESDEEVCIVNIPQDTEKAEPQEILWNGV